MYHQNHPCLWYDQTLHLNSFSWFCDSYHRNDSYWQTLILLLNLPLYARQPYAYVRNPSMKILENLYEKAHHPIWICVRHIPSAYQENLGEQGHEHVNLNLPHELARQGN